MLVFNFFNLFNDGSPLLCFQNGRLSTVLGTRYSVLSIEVIFPVRYSSIELSTLLYSSTEQHLATLLYSSIEQIETTLLYSSTRIFGTLPTTGPNITI